MTSVLYFVQSASSLSDIAPLAPGNVLFMPIAAPLEFKWGNAINVEEVKWKDVSAYGVEAVKPETPGKPANSAELRKEAVMRLAHKVAVFKDQEILDDKQTLSQYSHARAELLKYLRMNCRWETDAIFWSQKVWWRCEIFCQHPDAPKKRKCYVVSCHLMQSMLDSAVFTACSFFTDLWRRLFLRRLPPRRSLRTKSRLYFQ